MELDGLDMEKVYAYKEANDDDALYKYLLITQCNALNSVLPGDVPADCGLHRAVVSGQFTSGRQRCAADGYADSGG